MNFREHRTKGADAKNTESQVSIIWSHEFSQSLLKTMDKKCFACGIPGYFTGTQCSNKDKKTNSQVLVV